MLILVKGGKAVALMRNKTGC